MKLLIVSGQSSLGDRIPDPWANYILWGNTESEIGVLTVQVDYNDKYHKSRRFWMREWKKQKNNDKTGGLSK